MADHTDTDQLREQIAENPGLDMVEEDDVPAYFPEDEANAEGGITKQEAERRASDDHQSHAPG
jgi:hypothetical protein